MAWQRQHQGEWDQHGRTALGMAGGRGMTHRPEPPWEGPIFFPVPHPQNGVHCLLDGLRNWQVGV